MADDKTPEQRVEEDCSTCPFCGEVCSEGGEHHLACFGTDSLDEDGETEFSRWLIKDARGEGIDQHPPGGVHLGSPDRKKQLATGPTRRSSASVGVVRERNRSARLRRGDR